MSQFAFLQGEWAAVSESAALVEAKRTSRDARVGQQQPPASRSIRLLLDGQQRMTSP